VKRQDVQEPVALTRKLAQSNVGKNARDTRSLVDELAGKYYKRHIKNRAWEGFFDGDEVKSETYLAVRDALDDWDPSRRNLQFSEDENLRQFLEKEVPRRLDQWRQGQLGAVSTTRDIRRKAEETLRQAAGVEYISDLSISEVTSGSRRIMPQLDLEQEESADAQVVGKLHERSSEPICKGDSKLIQGKIKDAKRDLYDLRFELCRTWGPEKRQAIIEQTNQRQADLAFWERKLREVRSAK
jgi:hypothetical protein